MKGPQDLGGMMGFGPINPEKDEPLFHAPWERRVLGFTVAMGPTGAWTGDQGRHKRESLPPQFYWSRGYYEIWFEALSQMLAERSMVTELEQETGMVLSPPKPAPRVWKAEDVEGWLAKGWPYDRPTNTQAAFAVGDRIRTKRMAKPGHTRLPAYAWDKSGVIECSRGCHVFPDSNGMGQGPDPRWLYTVCFTAEELWGKPSKDKVYLDLWEPYMEAA
jgi:nitrile hydratase subunit beta